MLNPGIPPNRAVVTSMAAQRAVLKSKVKGVPDNVRERHNWIKQGRDTQRSKHEIGHLDSKRLIAIVKPDAHLRERRDDMQNLKPRIDPFSIDISE